MHTTYSGWSNSQPLSAETIILLDQHAFLPNSRGRSLSCSEACISRGCRTTFSKRYFHPAQSDSDSLNGGSDSDDSSDLSGSSSGSDTVKSETNEE